MSEEGVLESKNRSTDPDDADTGFLKLYAKNGSYFLIDDAGVVTPLVPLTDEQVQDIVGAFVLGGVSIDAIYDDGANTLTINLDAATVASIAAKIPLTQKGAANGVATLDSGGRMPSGQLPTSAQEYKGAWNASTNTPTLIDGTGTNGDMYRASVAGTQDLGSGDITVGVGDQVIYNGTIWERIPADDQVISVNGFNGVIVLDMNDIDDVSAASPADGDFLRFNGSNYVPVSNVVTHQTMGYPEGENQKGLAYLPAGTTEYKGSKKPVAAKITAISSTDNGGETYAVRVIDKSNGDAVIAEATGLSNTTKAIQDLGSLSNLGVVDAVWDIEVKHESGDGKDKVMVESWSIEF